MNHFNPLLFLFVFITFYSCSFSKENKEKVTLNSKDEIKENVTGVSKEDSEELDEENNDSIQAFVIPEEVDKEEEKKEVIKSKKEDDTFLEVKDVVILSLIFLTLFFGFITMFLLRWRLKHNKTLTTFPENLFDTLESLNINSSNSSENFKKQVEHFNKVLKYIRVTQDTNSTNFNEIIESFTKLNDSIVEKENQIKQLRKGYESKETISLVRGMMRLHATIYDIANDEKNSEETRKETNFILVDLEEKLKEAGVESYSIDPGISVKSDVFGMPESSDWIIEQTHKKEKDNLVSSTQEKGFYYNGEDKTILKYVKIKVFKLN